MKRSEINTILRWAKQFVAEHDFRLPPFAFWTPEDWRQKGHECDEIRDNALGWDITDFGLGDFERFGLAMFTIRNGNCFDADYPKPYAEKMLITREEQVTPLHFHWSKMEDIINRAGGNLAMRLFSSAANEEPEPEGAVTVSTDGVIRTVPAGGELILRPGESITLPCGLYHEFWAERGAGPVLVGEVSAVNDDNADNRFAREVGRFPEIEEDEPPVHYLCNEYPQAG